YISRVIVKLHAEVRFLRPKYPRHQGLKFKQKRLPHFKRKHFRIVLNKDGNKTSRPREATKCVHHPRLHQATNSQVFVLVAGYLHTIRNGYGSSLGSKFIEGQPGHHQEYYYKELRNHPSPGNIPAGEDKTQQD